MQSSQPTTWLQVDLLLPFSKDKLNHAQNANSNPNGTVFTDHHVGTG